MDAKIEDFILSVFTAAMLVLAIFIFVISNSSIRYKESNIKTVSDTIYNNGKQASKLGIDILANPYSQEHYREEHIIWFQGYVEGYNK